ASLFPKQYWTPPLLMPTALATASMVRPAAPEVSIMASAASSNCSRSTVRVRPIVTLFQYIRMELNYNPVSPVPGWMPFRTHILAHVLPQDAIAPVCHGQACSFNGIALVPAGQPMSSLHTSSSHTL